MSPRCRSLVKEVHARTMHDPDFLSEMARCLSNGVCQRSDGVRVISCGGHGDAAGSASGVEIGAG